MKWMVRFMSVLLAVWIADILIVLFAHVPYPRTTLIILSVPALIAACAIIPLSRTDKS
jgi:hypothetical protein